MKSQQKDNYQNDEKLLFGLVLFDTKEDKSEIEKTIENILKIDYPPNKLKIIICSYLSENKNKNTYINYANILLNKFRHTRLLLNHPLETDSEVDYNAFTLCRNAEYLIKINHNQKINSDFFRKTSKIQSVDTQIIKQGNVVAIPKKLVSKNYLDFNNYDNMIEHLLNKADQNNLLEI